MSFIVKKLLVVSLVGFCINSTMFMVGGYRVTCSESSLINSEEKWSPGVCGSALSCAWPPWVITWWASNVDPWGAHATLHGKLLSRGGTSSCDVWFVWDTKFYVMHSSYAHRTPSRTKYDLGWFSETITGLHRGTTYHFRAVAYNGEYYDQGVDLVFTPGFPSVATLDASGVTANSAVLRGRVEDTGDVECEIWFVYDTSSHDFYEDYRYSSQPQYKNHEGDFSQEITSLKCDTKYYFRAVIRNDVGTGFGLEKNFTTRSGSNNPPYMPCDPYPANGSVDVDVLTELRWVGGDPDDDPVTYDVYFGVENPPPIRVCNHSDTSYDPGMLAYNQTYFWRIVSHDNNGASTSGPIWMFTTKSDEHAPVLKIVKPENALYLFDTKIRSFLIREPLIIGGISVIADAYDNESGISEVIFYVDGIQKKVSTSEPYVYMWDEAGFGRYDLDVVAVDNAGNSVNDEIMVWKFF